MAKPKSERPSSRVHVWLFTEDWEFCKEKFGSTVGASKAVRLVLEHAVKNWKAKADAAARPLPDAELVGLEESD